METKNYIKQFFEMNGLLLKRDARDHIGEFLENVPREEHKKWMNNIINHLQQQRLESSIITIQNVYDAVKTVKSSADGLITDRVFQVIDAFTIPKFVYNQERKKFIPAKSSSADRTPRPLYGGPSAKAGLYLDRYHMIYQRLLRHELFYAPGSSDTNTGARFQLKPVEYLLGCSQEVGDVVILGMLTQLKEGSYYLEDPTGAIKIDLSESKFHTGFFTECSFVLAEGSFNDGVLRVKGLGFPPAEPAVVTRGCFGNVNFFGGTSAVCVKSIDRLRIIEETNVNASFVFIADVWLDDVKVMNKLYRLFAGFSDFPPTCFVLLGNFTSAKQDDQKIRSNEGLYDCFCQLGDMILEFPSLAHSSKFIFIPGPLDPGLKTILPRPPIALSVTEGLRKRLPGAVFTTNPCRVQYCTQEIVVFREDLVTKMCRNCVYFPTQKDVPTHFAKTLASQSHLCPLPLHVMPVYWEYSHTLNLFPLPDMVVCADKFDPFSVDHCDCNFMNPSSFSRNDYIFKVYIPSTRQVEDSRVPDD